ncbi:complement C1q domain-containing protein [Dyadobacter sp. CY356]|uniref:complement C1q domain-containing protein n=1 Tax=Dyadobacter sp. CY356 TaxID=2906442 RepID=UPI001F3B3C76|nr:complement C1q domain-containing protein [Dyadobacter sp. CY356]MCF0054854.1 complement C1q domain-containing protein [Dyadobacter sp. CY356]
MNFKASLYHPLAVKMIFSILFFSGVLFNAPDVFAQVKIGTNPTSINAANNLEVESATVGNKVSIDKTSGKMTIADGSQGTGKVLTSDANGVATWEAFTNGTCSAFEASKTSYAMTLGTAAVLMPGDNIIDPANAYNPATGIYTVPAKGTYIFTATAGEGNNSAIGTRNSQMSIQTGSKGIVARSILADVNYANGLAHSLSVVVNAEAGETVFIMISSAVVSGSGSASGKALINTIRFAGSRIDCNRQ